MTRLLVWGAGGNGKVVAELVRASGHELVGYVDSDGTKLGQAVDSFAGLVICTEDELLQLITAGKVLPRRADAVVPAVGDNAARLRHYEALNGRAAKAIVHP